MDATRDSDEDGVNARADSPDAHDARTPCAAKPIEIDTDVLNWFRARGGDYERLINAVLRKYVQLHEQKLL